MMPLSIFSQRSGGVSSNFDYEEKYEVIGEDRKKRCYMLLGYLKASGYNLLNLVKD